MKQTSCSTSPSGPWLVAQQGPLDRGPVHRRPHDPLARTTLVYPARLIGRCRTMWRANCDETTITTRTGHRTMHLTGIIVVKS
jgi:hypothetical protein